MANPVGLAANIVGLITVAPKASKLCYSETTNSQDIVRLVPEILHGIAEPGTPQGL